MHGVKLAARVVLSVAAGASDVPRNHDCPLQRHRRGSKLGAMSFVARQPDHRMAGRRLLTPIRPRLRHRRWLPRLVAPRTFTERCPGDDRRCCDWGGGQPDSTRCQHLHDLIADSLSPLVCRPYQARIVWARPFRLDPANAVELPLDRGNTRVFRMPGPVRLLVPLFFYRSFYRVPRVGAWNEKQS